MTEDMKDYIKKMHSSGYSYEDIQKRLVTSGWDAITVTNIIETCKDPATAIEEKIQGLLNDMQIEMTKMEAKNSAERAELRKAINNDVLLIIKEHSRQINEALIQGDRRYRKDWRFRKEKLILLG